MLALYMIMSTMNKQEQQCPPFVDSAIAGHMIHSDDIKRLLLNASHASAVKAWFTHIWVTGRSQKSARTWTR